jgi:hypothetical protein
MKANFKNVLLAFLFMPCSGVVSAQFRCYDSGNSNLVSNDCSRIAVDQNGHPWIGHSDHGASAMDSTGASFINYSSGNSLLDGGFVSFVYRDGSRIWMAEFNHGLFFHDQDNTWGSVTLPDYSIYGLYRKGNDLWVATKNAGIFRYNMITRSNTVYDINNALPGNYILRITGDSTGNIWAGTGFSGALKFDGSVWADYNSMNTPLPSDNVYCVTCDEKGNVWFGTDRGLAKKTASGTWTIYDSTNSQIPSNYIRTIVWRDSNIIVATGYNGLGILNTYTNNWKVYNTHNSNLPSFKTWDVALSDEGDIWAVLPDKGVVVLPKTPNSISELNSEGRMVISPDPATDIISVEYVGIHTGSYTISLITTDGRFIVNRMGKTVNSSVKEILDVSFLSPGLYMLQIAGDNFLTTGKLLIK